MASDEFKQEALFDQNDFNSPGPEKYRYETAEELLERGEFGDSRFWEALNRDRKRRRDD